MSRYGKREYQIGDYWLSQRGNSPAWCRTWFDPSDRQTKRASLSTTDFEEAKQALTDWFVANHIPKSKEPEDHSLATIIARYWQHHGQHIISAERTRISLDYWLDFYGERTLADITDVSLQEGFHTWLKEKGMRATTVRRVLSAGRAAINFAWKRGEIANAPYIIPVTDKERKAAPPKGRPLEVDEVAKIFDTTKNPSLRMFIILMIATAARPDAIRELTRGQCDVKNRLIKLNPDERAQTKKYRPTLRMPESIVPVIKRFDADAPEVYLVGGSDEMLKSVRTTWLTMRKNAKLDDQVNPYSLRHTMARWLRKSGVPAWEVSAQLGHKRQDLSITEVYAPYDPGYLGEATKAIDSFFAELRANSVLVNEMLGELST